MIFYLFLFFVSVKALYKYILLTDLLNQILTLNIGGHNYETDQIKNVFTLLVPGQKKINLNKKNTVHLRSHSGVTVML